MKVSNVYKAGTILFCTLGKATYWDTYPSKKKKKKKKNNKNG